MLFSITWSTVISDPFLFETSINFAVPMTWKILMIFANWFVVDTFLSVKYQVSAIYLVSKFIPMLSILF